MTGHGTDIKTAQYIFAVLYILTLVCVFAIYHKTASVSTCIFSPDELMYYSSFFIIYKCTLPFPPQKGLEFPGERVFCGRGMDI